jgi:hypothetical protein
MFEFESKIKIAFLPKKKSIHRRKENGPMG